MPQSGTAYWPYRKSKTLKQYLNIRLAEGRDIPVIATIADETELFPSDMLEAMIDGYLTHSTRDIWFVGDNGGDVISFCFCEPERMTDGTWNLLAIGVSPPSQGQGHGARMMAYLEAYLAGQSERILLVETMGTPEFGRTREFYRKNGYVEEARIREFYGAGADKVVFWKHL